MSIVSGVSALIVGKIDAVQSFCIHDGLREAPVLNEAISKKHEQPKFSHTNANL